MTSPIPMLKPVTLVNRRLILPAEAWDKSEETADDGKDLQVNLSSDVLFAVGKADLTASANSIMARTAKLIDASASTTVTVAGHADSSGNDAINEPLSLRRAQAVERALIGAADQERDHLPDPGVRLSSSAVQQRQRRGQTPQPPGHGDLRQTCARYPGPVATTPPSVTGLTGTSKAEGQPIAMEIAGLRRLPGGLGLLTYEITNQGSAEARVR